MKLTQKQRDQDESVMKSAQKTVEYSKATIIKMHKFVMDLLDLKR